MLLFHFWQITQILYFVFVQSAGIGGYCRRLAAFRLNSQRLIGAILAVYNLNSGIVVGGDVVNSFQDVGFCVG